MTPPATGTVSQTSRERREAVRALLMHPLLTSDHAEELALVRLHAAALRSMFKSTLDYHLVVESTFARLVKGPVSGDGPARPARRADGSAFTATTYTFLAGRSVTPGSPAQGGHRDQDLTSGGRTEPGSHDNDGDGGTYAKYQIGERERRGP